LVEDSYHKDRIANRRLHPETLMMGYGYAPGLSEGSLKPPIFLTSTFVFENAQQGSLRIQAVVGGKGAGALFRRLELGSNTRRRAGAAVKNACHRASTP
jgi:cystathionine beta-lyase/cystathionine gamma-synthase